MVRAHHLGSVPLIITGALLSTLHQSTLGTLFTMMSGKMHPLWYSPILPILFFFSCIAAGMAMIIFESSLSKRFLKHETPRHLLLSISRGLVLFLGIYGVIRFTDISTRGALGLLFANAYETPFFWIEMFLFIFIPIALLLNKRIRSTPRGLFIASLCVVLGFLMHRMNVVTTAFARVSGGYFPTWQEFLISTSFIIAGFIIVGLIARNFPLFEKAAPAAEGEEEEGYVKIGWSV